MATRASALWAGPVVKCGCNVLVRIKLHEHELVCGASVLSVVCTVPDGHLKAVRCIRKAKREGGTVRVCGDTLFDSYLRRLCASTFAAT